jgi:hypothetical protein
MFVIGKRIPETLVMVLVLLQDALVAVLQELLSLNSRSEEQFNSSPAAGEHGKYPSFQDDIEINKLTD